jgi:hypothetical protein
MSSKNLLQNQLPLWENAGATSLNEPASVVSDRRQRSRNLQPTSGITAAIRPQEGYRNSVTGIELNPGELAGIRTLSDPRSLNLGVTVVPLRIGDVANPEVTPVIDKIA